MFQIKGGFDQLPKAFEKFVEYDIIFNARVNRVEYGSNSLYAPVTAYFTDSADREIPVYGDVLLNTATATSTTFIEFSPRLPKEKYAAHRSVHYASATKIVLVFDRPFWEDDGIVGGHSTTDLPSRMIYYPVHKFPSGKGVLLASYTWADDSTKFLGLSDEDAIQSCLNDLAKIHGEHIRGLHRPELGFVKRWSADPYAIGPFVIFTPYQLRNIHDELSRPHENLYFAGEHTELPHAWIDTAMSSAIQAVACIAHNDCYASAADEADTEEKEDGGDEGHDDLISRLFPKHGSKHIHS